MHRSSFNGRRIQPPDSGPTIVHNKAIPEAKEKAIKLSIERGFSHRQIARLLYREFNVSYSAQTVGVWVRSYKKAQELTKVN